MQSLIATVVRRITAHVKLSSTNRATLFGTSSILSRPRTPIRCAHKMKNANAHFNYSMMQIDALAEESKKLVAKEAQFRKLKFEGSNNRVSFIIPRGAAQLSYEGLRTTWPAQKFPPWIDRLETLRILLKNAYDSLDATKPVVTMYSTGPGFGKTRTLVEWGIQVFQHPCVVDAFLRGNKDIDLSVTKDISQQIADTWRDGNELLKKRAVFLVTLHRTLREHTVITVTATQFLDAFPEPSKTISEQQVAAACKRAVGFALKERFPGEGTPTIPFDDTTPDFSRVSVNDMIQLYLDMVDETLPPYSENDPIVNNNEIFAQLPPRVLLINVDEFQALLEYKAIRDPERNMAYEVARSFLFNQSHRIVNMTGLMIGPVSELEDHESSVYSLRTSLPLDPLLGRDYLNAACKSLCGRPFYQKGNDKSLPERLSDQLHELWISTCGVPRTIERLAKYLSTYEHAFLSTVPHTSSAVFSDEKISAIYSAMQLDKSLESVQKSLGLDDGAFNELLIDAVFCHTKAPTDMLGSYTYEFCESRGLVIPFQFDRLGNEMRKYTIPFFMYKESHSAIAGFASDLSGLTHKVDYNELPIQLEFAIKALGRTLMQNDTQTHSTTVGVGQILEIATAVSTWLRYLKATKLQKNKVVPLSAVLPLPLKEDYIKLKGVVQLHNQIGYVIDQNDAAVYSKADGFDSGLEFVRQNSLIAINRYGSSFADVLVPLCDKEGRPTKMLCIQCRNVKTGGTSIKPFYIWREATRIMKEESSLIYVVVSPNISTKLMSSRSKNHEGDFKEWEKQSRILISTGENWLSDWFLRTFKEKLWLPAPSKPTPNTHK